MTFKVWKLILLCGIFAHCHLYVTSQYWGLTLSLHECPPDSEFQWPCPSTQQPDKSLVCIHNNWTCDHDIDCPEGEDEQNCPDSGYCDDGLSCKDDPTMCIPSSWICDGDLDCDDGSDEPKSNCSHLQNLIPCLPNEYRCPGTRKCIPLSYVCDNKDDCDAGVDENNCFDDKCSRDNIKCENCVETVDGPVCYCSGGYQWNKRISSCIDLNECEHDQYCDQPSKCTNSDGSFTCSCGDGYQLEGVTACKAVNEPETLEPTIFLANHWDIRQFNLDGSNLNPPFVMIGERVASLEFHHRRKKVCWITHHGNYGNASLLCGPVDKSQNSEIETIPVKIHLATVDSFAVDWVTGNWYFTDPVLKRVAICTFTGEFCVAIVTEVKDKIKGPKSIVINPLKGNFYFADHGGESDSNIFMADLTGANLQSIVSTKTVKPGALCIDYANEHLYFADMALNVIERVNLDGTERRLIAIGKTVENIYGISVLENFLYVSDRHNFQILKIHRYNYTMSSKTLVGNLSQPGDLHIYHRVLQPAPDEGDPCSGSECDHICALDKDLKPVCLCAVGYQLDSDMKKCTSINNDICGTEPLKCELEVGERHCSQNCTLELCPPKYAYCPSDETCVPIKWWCDEKVDCSAGEDEGINCRYEECLQTEFTCQSGQCIDLGRICDNNYDCGELDHSDEINCDEKFSCDEENLFACNSTRKCISYLFVCDGSFDCEDGSDEQNCDDDHTKWMVCHKETEFACRNGDECINLDWKCDGEEDCVDGSDESDCDDTKKLCHEGERACDSGDRCIPEGWFCDREPDCLDRSDESDKNCPASNFTCFPPYYKCDKDGFRLCLSPQHLCDGKFDCEDHSDEGELCASKKCDSTPPPCSHICYNSPSESGYICDCPLLMKLNSSKTGCIEAWAVDDMCRQWGICGQDCKVDASRPHGYRCACFDGYFLEPDRFTCKPQESHPVYVVYSNRHEIRRVDTANDHAVSLLTGLRNTIALDFYYEGGKPVLFWTDVMEDKIYRGTMQGNSLINVEAVIEVGLATTEGLAIDWVGKNIYWVESNLDQIEVARLDGTNRTTLIAGNMVSPRAIVVDPRLGALFWTDWDGHNPRIEGCSMSGEERKVIHQIIPAEGGGWPNGLTVDYDFMRLYWIDARSESIHSITYNGLDHRLIIRGHEDMSHPFALSLFGNYVYWTDWSSNAVVRANKFNGSNVHIVQKTISQPFDLQIIHPKRQPIWPFDKPNGCTVNNGGCSDLCLLNYNQTVSCRCPHRKKLDTDRKTCIPDEKFLLFVKNNEIRGVDVEQAHFSVIPVITVPHVDKPTSIDYDTKTSTLYWADKGLNVINRANITDGSVVETLIDSGLSNPEGFAIDWLSGNMYFSSYDLTAKTASISVATLSGSYRTELIFRNITQPKSIALHPKRGLMFFVDKDGEKSKVCRARMDGFELLDIVKNLDEPISLSVDFSDDILYFINSGNNSIMQCDLNGQNCRPVVASDIKSPKALTVYENHIYVSDTDKIVYINKDGSEFKELRNSTPDVNALLLYDKSQRQATADNGCVTKKSYCSQLCLLKSEKLSQCKCTAGYKLKPDLRSCEGIRSFLLYAKETEIRGHLFETNQSTQALAPISKILSASAIDFHAESDYIYWVDTKANTISRIKRDLTKREIIIKDGINSVEGLAVDWIAGNIYWTDAGHSIIEMAKLNGLNRYIIASGDMEKPRSIVVHPELGYLYWSDWGLDSRIERANLDGSERAQYIYTNMAKPWGLTIDYRSHYLYWCDMELRKIEAVSLLFYKRIVVVAEAGVQPVSVTVFNQNIYWIDGYEDGKILKAKSDVVNAKVGSPLVTTIQTNLGPNLKDIKAFDRSRQLGTNLCSAANGGCESLCFYRSDNQVKCACSFGKLDVDKKSCTNYDGFILYSKVTGMESINLRDGNNPNAPYEPFQNQTHLRNVIGLSFDYNSKRIFFSDIQRGDIQFVHFDKTNYTTIVEGIGSAEGIAYEAVQGNLFWTSYTNSCISKINVEDALKNKALKPDVVIQMSKMDHPRAVVVDSCQKFLFWTNWNNEKPRIQRSNLQGLESRDVITKDILTPNGLTIDHKARKLYWSDARLDKIERCDMDGLNRIVIITSIPQHSFGLAVYEDNLFWTDWMLRAVIRANKYDGTGIVWLRKNLERQPMGIIAIANDSQDCSVNECHNNKYGCQDLCLTDELGQPYCHCTHGRLAADGRNCIAGYNCSSVGYEAFTCLNGYCLRFEKSCNGIMDCVDGYDENPKVCVNRTCPPNRMFSCANRTLGQCIPLSKQCDGIVDCRDGSDESSCPCPPGQFRCKNGMCIPKIYRCNGIRECFDGSDEMVCGDICKKGEFTCNGSNPLVDCIPEEKVCDHRNDCGDNSDEENCDYQPKPTCDGNMFQCDKGECISMSWRCDRDIDCPNDNSDETDCNYTCKSGQHKCPPPGNNCIQESWVCDGNDDCGDNSDEMNCDDKHCTDDQFACSDSDNRCISMKWVCDMEVDCQNGEDEDPKNKNISAGTGDKCRNEGPITCEEGEFACANGLCIDQSFYCDSDDDCGDKSDEPDTCDNDTCAEGQFLCKDGYCISLSLRCDGKNDCADKSDELNCTQETPCGDDTKFLCRNKVCIDEELTCNGRNDCGDHSDEVSSCNVNECDVYSPCSHICVEKKIGYQCKCYEGFKLSENNRTCVDIDECKTQYPCSQFCFNTVGSYYCKCAEHYKLEPVFGTCTLSDQEDEPYLLVSNRYYIRKVNFTTGDETILLSGLTHSVAIDFDYEGQMLYWTDIQSQNSFIYRAPLNSTGKADKTSSDAQVLHSSTVLNPDGIAVDWIGRNLYWCDRNTDTIEVSKLDGRFRKIIMKDKTFLREPRALEVFPKRGYIFLSDWGDSPHISRVAMDGSMWEKIVTDEIAWPNALTIDYITEKLFWADANFDYIATADLDGKNRHVITSDNLPHTFAMTTFTDFIFWTDWETNTVYRAMKFSGDKRIPFTSMIHRPMDLVVYHRLRQTKMDPNPCEAANCSHLCLLRPAGETVEAVCACPEYHKLDNETQTCEANCTSSQFLCVKSSKCIPLWWKCDNSTDCDDGSDEHNCSVVYHCSQPGMFQCTNASSAADCIPPIGICDGTPQCSDGSDEMYLNNCADYTCLPHQFKCKKDNKCIPDNKKCDNNSDCSDGSDEKECEPKECSQSQFKCNSTKCIPYLWQCDGDNDCGDWSDEQKCSNRTCIDDYFKCAKSGKCIPKAWECDGENDCGKGDPSDEDETTCSKNTCDPTYFRCRNSHCIPGRWRCDNDRDCFDGSDEKNCPKPVCSESQWMCVDQKLCIQKTAVCDGRLDCRDNSDESNCTTETKTCSPLEFQCTKMHSCIPKSWQCDHDKDCIDGSDEENCSELSCDDGEFRCGNETKCMSLMWQCDGEEDCKDGSDERITTCSRLACPVGRFRCSVDHTCIPLHKKCNGIKDCKNGEDEDSAFCAIAKCADNEYKCNNGRQCIHTSKLCDSVPDCMDDGDGDDGDDEADDLCSSDNTEECGMLQKFCTRNCTHYTKLQKDICTCETGYRLADDGFTCEVVDLCAEWGVCSQKCKAGTRNKTVCYCDDNFKPVGKGHKGCEAKGNYSTVLLIAEEDQLIKHQLENYTIYEITSSVKHASQKITSIDVDVSSPNGDWLLFAVYTHPGKIVKIPLEMGSNIATKSSKSKDKDSGSNPTENNQRKKRDVSTLKNNGEEIHISGLLEPQGIAVDWIGKHIYWTDAASKKIEMMGYTQDQPLRRRTVYRGQLKDPFSIVVNPVIGKIFWTDRGYPPKIASANLDGSRYEVIVDTFLSWPCGLAIDYYNERLYWADAKSHTVETAKYDGSDRHIVRTFDKSDPPYMLDVYEDYLYVSTYKQHKVLKFSKFYNKMADDTQELKDKSMFVGDIVTYQIQKQNLTQEKGACVSNPCLHETQMCINNPSGTSQKYSCLCPDGAHFDGHKCAFIMCNSTYCKNGGNCSVTQNSDFKCSCQPGYYGKQCEVSVCDAYCYSGGICSVGGDGNPTCKCGDLFYGDRCEMYKCAGYCKNGGICSVVQGQPRCMCRPGYTGESCETEKPQNCENYCENGGTCSFVNGNRKCTCKSQYKGERCEQCGLQDSTTYCANDGICTYLNKNPVCSCKPGFDNRTNCERKTCEGYCLNNAPCMIMKNNLYCKCSPGYEGERCETTVKDCSSIKCLNGGNCTIGNTMDHSQVQCECPPGFYGARCEMINPTFKCPDFCLNGGSCDTSASGELKCVCSKYYMGRQCETCKCVGGKCKQDLYTGNTTCECDNKTMEGELCEKSICRTWCFNDAECVNCQLHTYNSLATAGQCEKCICKPGFEGPRCHLRRISPQGPSSSTLVPIVVSVVLAILVLLGIIFLVIIKKQRGGQFRHSRLKDGANLEVSNPVYMPQTTEEEEDESRQPLDQPYDFDPEKSTNFANPIYEQYYTHKDSRQELLKGDDSDDEDVPKNKL